jgi:hypothetical protein
MHCAQVASRLRRPRPPLADGAPGRRPQRAGGHRASVLRWHPPVAMTRAPTAPPCTQAAHDPGGALRHAASGARARLRLLSTSPTAKAPGPTKPSPESQPTSITALCAAPRCPPPPDRNALRFHVGPVAATGPSPVSAYGRVAVTRRRPVFTYGRVAARRTDANFAYGRVAATRTDADFAYGRVAATRTDADFAYGRVSATRTDADFAYGPTAR